MENRELISELEALPVARRGPAPLESIFPSLCELPRQPPRREMLPGLGWKSVLNPSMLAFFPVLAFLLVLPFFIAAQMKNEAASRRTATAKVVQIERFGDNQIFVKYRFDVANRAYDGATAGVADSLLSLVEVGDPLQVGFEVQNPQKSVPDFSRTPQGNPQNEFPWPVLFVFPLMALFIMTPLLMPLLMPLLSSQIRARRLFSQGVLTTGRLVFVKPALQVNTQHAGSQTLIYEWQDQQNQPRRGSMKCNNPWLMGQLRPDCPVVVAYHPQKPGQSVLLEPFVA